MKCKIIEIFYLVDTILIIHNINFIIKGKMELLVSRGLKMSEDKNATVATSDDRYYLLQCKQYEFRVQSIM